jgi:RNA recognition motif-containing protein
MITLTGLRQMAQALAARFDTNPYCKTNKIVTMNIQVSNLSHNTVDGDLRKLFSTYGEVLSAKVLRDRINGRSRGTAVVDMISDEQGALAITALHRKHVDGKAIAVTRQASAPSAYKQI